ncbi:LysR family transcriptional regulator [Pseudoxanthomonas kalamensis DSM 18571]|uniref:LysR family transcriptional regulator n=1 Tax=Pseudoxanthomonas kalamensis TaxID=289483 RepID=UPI001390D4C3|nr:LysR family transcriptional regulator [Pseudoxanthomonas kalamensis]KAF1712361.1 LysR family transcriptional regulator [Pseudoxanthomonas kalamensis DSM 18571]
MSLPSLPAVLAFARVAQHASFSRAAAELEVSPSSLSQTIRQLERRLGVRLFNRTTRRVGLTEYGVRFLEQVRPGLAQIDSALRDLENVRDVPTGHLRINLTHLVAEQLVLPRLPEFRRRYPQVQVELFEEAALADLVAGGFDAGIRLGESLARGMVALPVGPMQRQVVVAAPDYFARRGVPATPAELTEHDCIRYRRSNGRLMPYEFNQDGRDFEVEIDGSLIVNNSDTGRLMALAGLGVAQLFETQAAADLAEGRLRRVLDAWQPPFPGWHIYYPAREQLPPKLRVFIDFLRETAG